MDELWLVQPFHETESSNLNDFQKKRQMRRLYNRLCMKYDHNCRFYTGSKISKLPVVFKYLKNIFPIVGKFKNNHIVWRPTWAKCRRRRPRSQSATSRSTRPVPWARCRRRGRGPSPPPTPRSMFHRRQSRTGRRWCPGPERSCRRRPASFRPWCCGWRRPRLRPTCGRLGQDIRG